MQIRFLFIIAVAIMLTSAAWIVKGQQNGKSRDAAKSLQIPVRVMTPEQREIRIPVQTSGRLASKAELRMSFKVGGILQKLHVDEGQRVRRGQLLASLDPAEIQARVRQAESASQKAERDLKRAENLYADSVATLEQVQNARTAREVAQSDLRIARFNSRHARIIAPSNGKILRRFAERNEVIAPGQPVFQFGSAERDWIVRVSVTDRDILRLQLNDPAEVRFDAYPGQVFAGVISEVGETADRATGTFEVEIRLENTTNKLVSGFFARVSLMPVESTVALVLPASALHTGAGREGSIFIADTAESIARQEKIRILKIAEREILIQNSLPPASQVVIEGVAYLRDRASIRILPDEAGAVAEADSQNEEER